MYRQVGLDTRRPFGRRVSEVQNFLLLLVRAAGCLALAHITTLALPILAKGCGDDRQGFTKLTYGADQHGFAGAS